MIQLLNDKSALVNHIAHVLYERFERAPITLPDAVDPLTAAGVLLLLSDKSCNNNGPGQPCLVLNKRSLKVRQPGDICCPGGRVAPLVDAYFARLLSLPWVSLARWKYWRRWKKNKSPVARLLALFWATALRESFEEMRLNPFGVRFLGPLPPQPLVMFQRTIYPSVAWINRQKRFFPNWEVEKVVDIPLIDLLNPANYAQYRLCRIPAGDAESKNIIGHYPCFGYQFRNDTELLWGATYRIVTLFLDYVFGFKPPGLAEIPIIEGSLDQNYLTGY
ncbi:MAG: CoA pyrophosphatase, partial [Desulfobacterales bacterium]